LSIPHQGIPRSSGFFLGPHRGHLAEPRLYSRSLIFALPPAEVAVHPAEEGGRAELYLMTDDVAATVAALRAEGIEVARPVSDQGWGLLTAIALPGGVELGLYQPRYPTATEPS
jgi:hypothetical protein